MLLCLSMFVNDRLAFSTEKEDVVVSVEKQESEYDSYGNKAGYVYGNNEAVMQALKEIKFHTY